VGVAAADALACGAAHVICVEPEQVLASRLGSLSDRYRNRISVWPLALDIAEGMADLLLSEAHNQGHTMSTTMTELFPNIFSGRAQRVRTTTIDVVEANKVATVWKLDIEGMEANAIRGARRTLECAPPRIILAELYDPFVDEVVGLLPGYQVERAALTKSEYTLKLLPDIGGALPQEFCVTSPTYLFTKRE
ncbi:MAG TPA: FkbM family methyltransferase, partial [Hyphomicrobiaceae bacterium]|nr:FkbM family methyltransferase [Hyphomicrobiaceae bacterium]